MKSEIVWFSVSDSLPFLGKRVLAFDGKTVYLCKITGIATNANDGWDVYWEGGAKVIHWAFLPEPPEVPVAEQPKQSEISVW